MAYSNHYGGFFGNLWSSWFGRGITHAYVVSFVGHNILLRSFASGLNAWTVVCLVFVHEEYLGVVDLTSHVIPTWLASYFLV